MHAFWHGSVEVFLGTAPGSIIGALAEAGIRHFRLNETTQLRAWEHSIDMLRAALGGARAEDWYILLEYPMLRLGRRPDCIILTDRAILVLEFKAHAKEFSRADCRQTEDYALDLHDFHTGSRRHPILPILVAEHGPAPAMTLPLMLDSHVSQVMLANATTLPGLLTHIACSIRPPAIALDHAAWVAAPYKPVPGIIDAACLLYAKHGVAEIRAARSDATNLRATTDAILHEIERARTQRQHIVLFVTGIPGAGKTLCGLNTIFGGADAARGTYLTGNPTLVHVLREALAQDAVAFAANRGDAERKMASAIQRLPDFRNEYVKNTEHIPPESIVVIDEAQRCWSRAYAVAKTRDKPIKLAESEPAHLLEAMARHDGFAAVICLIGSGQEIHDGEGGLAEWGNALRLAAPQPRGQWQVRVAPQIVSATDARQTLGSVPNLVVLPALHLDVCVRHIASTTAATWVDHLLAGDAEAAAGLAKAAGHIPFRLTRSLTDLRVWLRGTTRGLRRAGLLASSGAKRLRAEGLGVELPHMDARAVAHWFLSRFPDDIRASDALEVVATEFSCQGLELDYVGLCWDGDLVREPGRSAWRVRRFRGKTWQIPTGEEAIANQLNTYRVLMTRARYETVIFVPAGDRGDRTRSPAVLDAIAAYLRRCGVRELMPVPLPKPAKQELVLL